MVVYHWPHCFGGCFALKRSGAVYGLSTPMPSPRPIPPRLISGKRWGIGHSLISQDPLTRKLLARVLAAFIRDDFYAAKKAATRDEADDQTQLAVSDTRSTERDTKENIHQ
jgi:hypothetical protein